MFSVSPGLATNASAAAAAAAAFNPYLSPVSPGLMPQEIMPSTPVLMASSPNVSQVPNAAAAAAQKLLRTDRLEVTHRWKETFWELFPNKLCLMMCLFLSGSGVTQDDNEPVSTTVVVNKWFNKHMNNGTLYWTRVNCFRSCIVILIAGTIMQKRS